MIFTLKRFRALFLFLPLTVLCLLVSCGPKTRPMVSQLDTPEHHFNTGMKFLDHGRWGDAQREFELALSLNSKYSRAHGGMGLVKAYRNDYSGGFEELKKAWSYAGTKEEKLFVHVGYIRVNTLSHAYCTQVGAVCKKVDKDWLDISYGEFMKAVDLDPRSAAAYFFMGLCYRTALELNNAGDMFARVLALDSEYAAEADREWNLVQKIQRAMPGTVTGKQIAFVEKLTRADAAALLMEELNIDVLYKKRSPQKFDMAFKDPEKAAASGTNARIAVGDIASHPLKADIEAVLQLGVRGLEIYPDGTFRPGELVDRATYAMMIEDILIRVSGDQGLATRFIGQNSPFPDLRSDLPCFNAVMVVTTRGMMKAADLNSGEFVAGGSVTGADALLIIRELKDGLKFL